MRLLDVTSRIVLRLAATVMLTALPGAAPAEVAEPQGYWTGPMHGEVPATLSGARVLSTEVLAALIAQERPVLVDAADKPPRPDNLAPGAIWKPLPHENIAGSIWVPGIGTGQLAAELEAYFRERLHALTAGDLDKPIVFYCHPMCWASWNAAKRALSYGYRNVAWYPGGAEGWRDGGHALVTADPEEPPQAHAPR